MEDIEELAMAVAIVEHYQSIIDSKKEEIRNLTQEEINKINNGYDLQIKREKHTNTIYSAEYKEEVKKLQEKFPPKKETIENHTIKLSPTNYTRSKAEIIVSKIATMNKTQLKAACKVVKQ